MPQFTRQASRSMTADHYRRAAEELRRLASRIDHAAAIAHGSDATPRDAARLTQVLHRTSIYAQSLSERHRRFGRQPIADRMEPSK
jgi:hypothetical protein